jgi:hypothetical protein
MLIDNAHSLHCLDAEGAMQAGMKGRHVALLERGTKGGGAPWHNR